MKTYILDGKKYSKKDLDEMDVYQKSNFSLRYAKQTAREVEKTERFCNKVTPIIIICYALSLLFTAIHIFLQ